MSRPARTMRALPWRGRERGLSGTSPTPSAVWPADPGSPGASPVNLRHRWLADLSLLATTVVWGVTFVAVKEAVAELPAVTFLALRFTLAFAALAVLFWRDLSSGWRRLAGPGAVLGLFLWGGYTLQTVGLQFTEASRAAFITGLTVVLVPLLSAVLGREKPPGRALVGVALALVGLTLLFLVPPAGTVAAAGAGPAVPRTARLAGDLLVLGCTVCFGLQIVVTGHYSPTRARTYREAAALAAFQMGATALFCWAAVAARYLAGGAAPTSVLPAGASLTHPFSASTAGAIVVCGLFASAGAFLAQTVAQRFTPPTHTALIFALEPVWAAMFGWLLLGERLGSWGLGGCLAILAGMLVAELPDKASRQEREPAAAQAGRRPSR